VNKKTKNPLYVVTNDGKDVLEANGLFDALFKRLGIEPLIAQLEGLMQALLAMVTSYAVFSVVKEWLDQFVALLESIIKKVDPVLAFSLFN
tara:strand:- start:3082 stop:3354 length:273 start_codon:yes stop_codon:yes gene_type:complete